MQVEIQSVRIYKTRLKNVTGSLHKYVWNNIPHEGQTLIVYLGDIPDWIVESTRRSKAIWIAAIGTSFGLEQGNNHILDKQIEVLKEKGHSSYINNYEEGYAYLTISIANTTNIADEKIKEFDDYWIDLGEIDRTKAELKEQLKSAFDTLLTILREIGLEIDISIEYKPPVERSLILDQPFYLANGKRSFCNIDIKVNPVTVTLTNPTLVAKLQENESIEGIKKHILQLQAHQPSPKHIFISYSHEDKDYVDKLVIELEVRGFQVWVDTKNIPYGTPSWFQEITQGIYECAAMVVIMTPSGEKSEWVEREIHLSVDYKKPTFPLLLSGDAFPIFVTTQYANVLNGNLPDEKWFKDLSRITNIQ